MGLALLVRALTSEPTLTFALDEASRALEEQLGLTLVVAHIEVEAESARVDMGPVLLKGSDGRVLFSAERVRAEVAPLKLFEQRIRLEHLEVVRPRVDLRIVDGKIDGVRIPEGGGGQVDLPRVDVADLRLHGGTVDLRVSSQGQERVSAHLDGIEMRLGDRGRDEHRLKFTVAQAEVRRPLDDEGEDIVIVDSFGGRLAVKGDGLLDPSRVRVSDVTLSADDTEVSVAGEVVLGAPGLVPAFSADVAARSELAAALGHLHLPVTIRGGATLSAHVEGKAGARELTATGQIETADVRVDDFHFGSLRTRFVANEHEVQVADAAWSWAGTTLRGEATVRLDDALHTQVKASADSFSIYELVRDLGVPGAWADTRIDGDAEVSGTLRPLLLEGKGGGVFTELKVAGKDVRTARKDEIIMSVPRPIAAPSVAIRIDADSLRFEGQIDDGITRGGGFYQIFYDPNRGMLLDASAEVADFATIEQRIGSLAFAGRGTGRVHLEGPQSALVLTAELDVGGFALEDFAFGDASGKVHLFESVLSFRDVVAIKNGRSRYAGDVVLDFNDLAPDERGVVQESPHLRVDIAIEDAQAEDLRAIVPVAYVDGVLGFVREDLDVDGPVRGRLNAHGAVGDGTFDHMQGGGLVELLKGCRLLDQHLTGTAAFHLDLDRFFMDSLEVELAGGRGAATASVGRAEGDLQGELTLLGAQLASIDALMDTPRPFSGSFDVEARLGRTARDPGLTGSAQLQGAAYGAIPIGNADVKLDHAGRILTLTGELLSGRGSGVIHTETRSPYNYDAAVAVRHGPLAPLLPPEVLPESVSIALSGDVEARGALKSFRESRGALAINQLSLTARGLQLHARSDVAAHFQGTRLTFDLLDLVGEDVDLVTVRGLLADDAVDLALAGRGSLAALSRVWPRARHAAGRFSFDVALTGDLDHASMSGQGFVSKGAIALDGSAFPALEDLDAEVSFRGPNVVVERASARAEGGGRLQAQGAVTVDDTGVRAFDLELRTQRLKLQVPRWLDTQSSGRLTLRGDATLPTLGGELRVHSARYSEDINWERLLPDLRRRTSALDSLDTDDEDVRFDVHLIADRGIVVENNVLDLEAKGDLFLTGTEERPGLKGGVQLIRGNATFRGNRYRIARGAVDFVDTYRIMPVLDVEAETRVHDYDVTAHLSGPAQAPNIHLGSTPELSEIDIVSLLTFGFTQYEVRDAGGSVGVAGLEVVSAYTGLDKEIKRVLPEAMRRSNVLSLDELRLTSQFSMRAGASVPAVALGMEVNPGLWGVDGSRLRLQSTLVDATGSGTEQRVEWEKRFENNVRLRLVWNSEDDGSCPSCSNQWGDLGGDIWYRWEF